MTDLIATDVQGQTIDSAVVDLYELTKGATTFYFHAGVDSNYNSLKFRDKNSPSTIRTYVALPVVLEGVELTATGASARPSLSIANVTSDLKVALGIQEYDELVGSTIVRRQTLEKYLDNGAGNSANPPIELSSVSFNIDRVGSLTNVAVSFELAAVYDLEGIQIPRRIAIGKYCSWLYQGQKLYGKGGCVWSPKSQSLTGVGGSTIRDLLFFNELDEPLVEQASLTSLASAYAVSTGYTQSSYVVASGKYYLSKQVFTSSASTPVTNSNYWIRVYPWTTWSGSSTYAKSVFVMHTTTENSKTLHAVWKSLSGNNTNNAPSSSSPHWERADLCGKTLNSCKCRFGGSLVSASLTNPPPTSAKRNVPLPFGSFPGSGNF
jgi:lambda family phage minor tail protein L